MNWQTNTFTCSNSPPITLDSLREAVAAAKKALGPPSERCVGVRVCRGDLEELKAMAEAMPGDVAEIYLHGLAIHVDPIVQRGEFIADMADGSTVIHRKDGRAIRFPLFDMFAETA